MPVWSAKRRELRERNDDIIQFIGKRLESELSKEADRLPGITAGDAEMLMFENLRHFVSEFKMSLYGDDDLKELLPIVPLMVSEAKTAWFRASPPEGDPVGTTSPMNTIAPITQRCLDATRGLTMKKGDDHATENIHGKSGRVTIHIHFKNYLWNERDVLRAIPYITEIKAKDLAYVEDSMLCFDLKKLYAFGIHPDKLSDYVNSKVMGSVASHEESRIVFKLPDAIPNLIETMPNFSFEQIPCGVGTVFEPGMICLDTLEDRITNVIDIGRVGRILLNLQSQYCNSKLVGAMKRFLEAQFPGYTLVIWNITRFSLGEMYFSILSPRETIEEVMEQHPVLLSSVKQSEEGLLPLRNLYQHDRMGVFTARHQGVAPRIKVSPSDFIHRMVGYFAAASKAFYSSGDKSAEYLETEGVDSRFFKTVHVAVSPESEKQLSMRGIFACKFIDKRMTTVECPKMLCSYMSPTAGAALLCTQMCITSGEVRSIEGRSVMYNLNSAHRIISVVNLTADGKPSSAKNVVHRDASNNVDIFSNFCFDNQARNNRNMQGHVNSLCSKPANRALGCVPAQGPLLISSSEGVIAHSFMMSGTVQERKDQTLIPEDFAGHDDDVVSSDLMEYIMTGKYPVKVFEPVDLSSELLGYRDEDGCFDLTSIIR